MKRIEQSDPADKWQWRTTRKKPGGEWIDSTAAGHRSPVRSQTSPPDAESDDRHMSSFDLLNGLDVADVDDASPGFDELFPDHGLDVVKTVPEGR